MVAGTGQPWLWLCLTLIPSTGLLIGCILPLGCGWNWACFGPLGPTQALVGSRELDWEAQPCRLDRNTVGLVTPFQA